MTSLHSGTKISINGWACGLYFRKKSVLLRAQVYTNHPITPPRINKQLVSAKVCAGFNLQVFLAGSTNSSKLSKNHSAGFNLQVSLAGSAF